MKLEEIKKAVRDHEIVRHHNALYTVEEWSSGFQIVCSSNQHAIGLTWTDEVTMNGKEEDFYIDNEYKRCPECGTVLEFEDFICECGWSETNDYTCEVCGCDKELCECEDEDV